MKERGGTRVCIAEHIRLKQLRIIKTVTGPPGSDDAVLKEACLMKQLEHPCIPKIYDIEEHEGGFSIIEEYIEGESFTSYFRTKTPGKEKIIALAIQLCSLLEYLHGQNPQILHLDLKPDNLLVKNESLYLIDFGSAVQGSREENEGELTGTPGYAAPECYRGEAGEGSDLYSVGKLIEFMMGNIVRSGWVREKRDLKKMVRIIKKATREKPSDRYPSASVMKHALESIRKKESTYAASKEGIWTVGLAGSGRRMGVTSFALDFARYIIIRNYRALYLECNESDAVLQMLSGRNYSGGNAGIPCFRGVPVEESMGSFRHKGGEGYRLSHEEEYYMGQGFQVVLEDFGVLTPENKEEFLKADLSLFFVGCKEWELENTWKGLCQLQKGKGSFLMLVNFSGELEFKAFARQFPKIPCRRIPMLAYGEAGKMEPPGELQEELLELLYGERRK